LKNLYPVILIFIIIFCSGFSDVFISYQPNVDRLEAAFKTFMPLKNGVIYTKVPRGLIVSIDEDIFFSEGDARIKESSLYVLDTIILLLQKLSNYCVIENHTEDNYSDCGLYKENWELSIARSVNLADYMIVYGKIPAEKLFSLGYGEYMPFKDNVSANVKGPDNRVDFVILEYEAKR